MTIARSTGAFIGTAEGTGVSLATTVSSTSSEIDVLGDNASRGELSLDIGWTFPNSAPTSGGTIDVYIYPSRISGTPASGHVAPVASIAPTQNETTVVLVNLPAQLLPTDRYMTVKVTNNATGQTITNLFVGYTLFKYS